MNFETHWIDVNPNLTIGQQPVFLLERPLAHGNKPKGGLFANSEIARVGHFWVPDSDVQVEPVQWALTTSGDHVRIPVVAYRSQNAVEAVMFWSGIQIGLQAADSLRRKTPKEIIRAIMVMGHQCHDLGEQGIRGYLGIAFQVKE